MGPAGVRSAICARREAHSHPNFVGWKPKISLGMQVGVRSGGCKEQNGKEREDDIKTHVKNPPVRLRHHPLSFRKGQCIYDVCTEGCMEGLM